MTGIHHRYTVRDKEKGNRLDVFLASRKAVLSRSQVRKAVDEGRVLVNGAPIKSAFRLRTGDIVDIEVHGPLPCALQPEAIALDIVYEDKELLVINKPAGVVVHPAPGHAHGTLVHGILHHCHDLSGIGGVMRPGIVHRLDRDTSGLLIVAKSDSAHQHLSAQFKARKVHKTYQVLVHGDVNGESGEINLPIGRHLVARKKMSTKSRYGKEAKTRWRVIKRFGVATLLEVDILTGRTHQIRVHLTSMGHSVVGDAVYGNQRQANSVRDPFMRSALKSMKRQALHAGKISFIHPKTGEDLEFTAPWPVDMEGLCRVLESTQSS
jgi:23S rRNA pseudouridine1911/1915/1917 synthase